MEKFDMINAKASRLVGLYYRPKEVREAIEAFFAENPVRIGLVHIVLESDNQYDSNAHKVMMLIDPKNNEWIHIGYVGKADQDIYKVQDGEFILCALINNQTKSMREVDKFTLLPVLRETMDCATSKIAPMFSEEMSHEKLGRKISYIINQLDEVLA